MQAKHRLTRRQFGQLLGLAAAGFVVALTTSGCENPFKPRSDYRGVITNPTRYNLCEVIIDGEVVATNVDPDAVFVCRKRLEGGVTHSFYARTDDPRVFSRSFESAVDDELIGVYEGFENVGWVWEIGRTFRP